MDCFRKSRLYGTLNVFEILELNLTDLIIGQIQSLEETLKTKRKRQDRLKVLDEIHKLELSFLEIEVGESNYVLSLKHLKIFFFRE